jgi:hypothetical protein
MPRTVRLLDSRRSVRVLGRTPSPLLASLRGAWHFDETSGAAQDSSGRGNHWSVTGAPGTLAGKLSTARTLTASDQFYQSIGADFLLGAEVSFTGAIWFYLPTGGGGAPEIWATGETTIATNADVGILLQPLAGGMLRLTAAQASTLYTVDTANSWSRDTWHLAFFWHDATANLLGVQLDGGSPVTLAHAVGVNAHPSGRVAMNGRSSGQFPGVVYFDETAWWLGKVLSADERAEFRQNGNGTAFPY